jgi:hypothetical protein
MVGQDRWWTLACCGYLIIFVVLTFNACWKCRTLRHIYLELFVVILILILFMVTPICMPSWIYLLISYCFAIYYLVNDFFLPYYWLLIYYLIYYCFTISLFIYQSLIVDSGLYFLCKLWLWVWPPSPCTLWLWVRAPLHTPNPRHRLRPRRAGHLPVSASGLSRCTAPASCFHHRMLKPHHHTPLPPRLWRASNLSRWAAPFPSPPTASPPSHLKHPRRPDQGSAFRYQGLRPAPLRLEGTPGCIRFCTLHCF